MKKAFTTNWKSSSQPRKQVKYRSNSPLHTVSKLNASPLSKDLRKKHNLRSVVIRKGDKVKIVRGQFKGKTGKVSSVDRGAGKVFIEKIEVPKKDGSSSKVPIHNTNVIIIDLTLDDKKRLKNKKVVKEGKNESS